MYQFHYYVLGMHSTHGLLTSSRPTLTIMDYNSSNMPRSPAIQQMYQKLMSTMIPNTKFHNRWIIDEESANAIKDDKEGNILGSHGNLNRIIANTWAFNHQGGQ